VTSFVLTTERVQSGAGAGKSDEDKPKNLTDTASPLDSDDQLLSQLKEVRHSEERTQGDPRHCYHQHITRHAVKGIL
jgi:hypothetical protein